MPDLGKYAVEVTLAYGVSLALIAGLIFWTWAEARAARRDLDRQERRDDP